MESRLWTTLAPGAIAIARKQQSRSGRRRHFRAFERIQRQNATRSQQTEGSGQGSCGILPAAMAPRERLNRRRRDCPFPRQAGRRQSERSPSFATPGSRAAGGRNREFRTGNRRQDLAGLSHSDGLASGRQSYPRKSPWRPAATISSKTGDARDEGPQFSGGIGKTLALPRGQNRPGTASHPPLVNSLQVGFRPARVYESTAYQDYISNFHNFAPLGNFFIEESLGESIAGSEEGRRDRAKIESTGLYAMYPLLQGKQGSRA